MRRSPDRGEIGAPRGSHHDTPVAGSKGGAESRCYPPGIGLKPRGRNCSRVVDGALDTTEIRLVVDHELAVVVRHRAGQVLGVGLDLLVREVVGVDLPELEVVGAAFGHARDLPRPATAVNPPRWS